MISPTIPLRIRTPMLIADLVAKRRSSCRANYFSRSLHRRSDELELVFQRVINCKVSFERFIGRQVCGGISLEALVGNDRPASHRTAIGAIVQAQFGPLDRPKASSKGLSDRRVDLF